MEAAENLSLAAERLSRVEGALPLRTLQAMGGLASDESNTVVFTLPLELLRALERFADGDSGT